MTNLKEIAAFCKTLSVESRVTIVSLLLHHPRLCVGALSKKLGITAGAVSQHLKELRHAGLVLDRKCGNYVHYELSDKALKASADKICHFFQRKIKVQENQPVRVKRMGHVGCSTIRKEKSCK